MFGDMGHGLFLFVVGVFLCLFDGILRRKLPAMEPVLSIRYLILLMGFFATYCGLIYNDFMAIPVWFFDSCYELKEKETFIPSGNQTVHHDTPHHVPMEAIPKEDCTYPVGVDPAWYMGKNELAFMNSLKMKLSVIFGVLQMSLGVVMKAFNAAYNGNKIDFFFEFVPQIILLLVLFGFMDLLIICKWLTDFTGREHAAPSIISTMIAMALNGGEIEEGNDSVVGSPGF